MNLNSNLRRWIALVVVCLGQLMIMLDTTIVNVALPFIQRDLGMSQADLTWVVNAYLISYGSFLLLAGRLGDLIGRRAVFLAGVFLFTVASVGTGFAPAASNLIAGRFIQGIGASLSAGVIIAIIVTQFQRPAERAQAMSVFTLVIAGGGSLGLLAGGLLTQFVNWHWIFFINLPIGVLTMVLGFILIPENEGLGLSQGIDVLGSVLVTAATMIGIYGIVSISDYGWASLHTVGIETIAVALLAIFVGYERRIANPIMPLRVLTIRSLTTASAARALLFTGISTSFFIGVLTLQQLRGYSAFEIGLAFLPTTLTLGVLSAGITARLMSRVGPRNLLLFGMSTIIAALTLVAMADDHASYFPWLLTGYALLGLGGGTSFLPLLTISMSEIAPSEAGLASGFSNATMQVGGALGLAAVGTVATNHAGDLIAHGEAIRTALAGGYQLGFLLGAASVALGLAVVIALIRPAPRPRVEVAASQGTREEVEAA
jgi:EmrB/QacA subfamily drug resistance transporter